MQIVKILPQNISQNKTIFHQDGVSLRQHLMTFLLFLCILRMTSCCNLRNENHWVSISRLYVASNQLSIHGLTFVENLISDIHSNPDLLCNSSAISSKNFLVRWKCCKHIKMRELERIKQKRGSLPWPRRMQLASRVTLEGSCRQLLACSLHEGIEHFLPCQVANVFIIASFWWKVLLHCIDWLIATGWKIKTRHFMKLAFKTLFTWTSHVARTERSGQGCEEEFL